MFTFLLFMIAIVSILATIGLSSFFSSASVETFVNINSAQAIALLTLDILMVTLGIFNLYYLKKNNGKLNLFCFIIKQLSMVSVIYAVLTLLIEICIPLKNTTKQDIITAITFAKYSFWLGIIASIFTIIIGLYINTDYIKKNNWYAFLTIFPGLAMMGSLYQKYLSWNHWLETKDITITKMAEMFNFYINNGAKVSVTLLNPYIKILFSGALLSLIIMIIVTGGMMGVYSKKKIEKHLKKRKQRKKESKEKKEFTS